MILVHQYRSKDPFHKRRSVSIYPVPDYKDVTAYPEVRKR